MQTAPLRDIEWSPIPDTHAATAPSLEPVESTEEAYGALNWAGARGRFGGSAFVLQEDGTLRCPAGASLWLQEQRQETPYSQRLVFCALREECEHCLLREQCLGRGARGNRPRRVSAVRRLLPLSRSPCEREEARFAIRWVDVAGRMIRRHWIRRLPQSIRGGDSSHARAGEITASSSARTPRSSPSALELERTT